MLCEAPHHARRPLHPLASTLCQSLRTRDYKIAAIAVAHRLFLFAMLSDGIDFSETRVGVEEGGFETHYHLPRSAASRQQRRLPAAG
jgi:hypothetical protein